VVLLLISVLYLVAVWKGRKPLSDLIRLLVRLPLPDAVRTGIEKSIQVVAGAETQVLHFILEKNWTLGIVLLITTIIWMASLPDYALALRFIGLNLPLVKIIGALTIVRIAFIVPTLGGSGTLEASQMLVMQAFGLSPAFGISLSLLMRGRDLLMGGLGLSLISWMTR